MILSKKCNGICVKVGFEGVFKKWGEGLKLKSWGYLGGVVKENEDLLLFDKRDFFEG